MVWDRQSGKFLAYKSAAFPAGIVGAVSTSNSHPSGEVVTPLRFPNNQPVRDLHALIENWDKVKDHLVPGTPVEAVESVTVLAPLRGRDVLCVGYNYRNHRMEFQSTGFDESVKLDYPEKPVIFTKRATAIVPTGAEIYPHPKVTSALDYEGELGIIIGKGGIGIKKEDAWEHVWGATIINDVTARDRQRDHKQFYIGKSLDTFCPMGPYAVQASALDFTQLHLETRLNGRVVQSQPTNELIFSIPELIETLSMGTTLQPGDVIATGTPEGVAAASGVFLKTGDRVDVTITGLGTLSNVVGDGSVPLAPAEPVLRHHV
ncbi:hypothetical protein DB88DRAFT_471322 [Papiliotrema laurentii]|uniref:Fumarylacetoacetase-like C-terminal domain-containing protein n=1 Tax=Papiliotrema laurentii TaxID=5418 RepID=A0AAD9L870_PAPLA|nr:hypothetical protein DB88DRAFT_471322 [Papiliotrema laurentii]